VISGTGRSTTFDYSSGKDVHHGDHGKRETSTKIVLRRVQGRGGELCRTSGKSIAQIARDLELSETALRRWIAQAEIDAGRRPGLTTDEHTELVALRKEVRVLREERDILKRATVFFAKETR